MITILTLIFCLISVVASIVAVAAAMDANWTRPIGNAIFGRKGGNVK